MTSKSKVDIKAFFETGDTPTAAQFIDLIDSYVDKSGPLGSIETAASAGTQGFAFCSANRGEIIDAAAARTFQGITVYTTALTSAAVFNNLMATTAQANTGTATGVLMDPVLTKNAIATLASSGAMVLLGTQTASNSATLDFTSLITSTYSTYIFEIHDLKPATDGVYLTMLNSTNNGSTWGSGYSGTFTVLDLVAGTSSTDISGGISPDVAGALVGNDTVEGIDGRVTLRNPLGTVRNKIIEISLTYQDQGGVENAAIGAAYRGAVYTDIDAVQFLFSSGNISSGVIRMYGMKAA